MPLGIPFTGGRPKRVNQFTTLSITPLGQSKAGSVTNQDKFRFLDALADLSPAQVIDVGKESNIHVAVAVRIAQELVNGGMAKPMSSSDQE